MAVVGYFEGTNPRILTRLTLEGVDVLPLSNGYDNHGKKLVGHLTQNDGVKAVIGYLHKVVPAANVPLTVKDILYNCHLHKIPLVLIVEDERQDRAAQKLGEMAECVQFASLDTAFDKVMKLIQD